MWPLFVLAGLVGAAVLWNLYMPAPPKAQPVRRPKMPQVSPKKDSEKERDQAEPELLIKMHACVPEFLGLPCRAPPARAAHPRSFGTSLC